MSRRCQAASKHCLTSPFRQFHRWSNRKKAWNKFSTSNWKVFFYHFSDFSADQMCFPPVDALRNFRLICQVHDTRSPVFTNSHVWISHEVIVCVFPRLVVSLQQRCLRLLQYDVFLSNIRTFAVVFVVHVTANDLGQINRSAIAVNKKFWWWYF